MHRISGSRSHGRRWGLAALVAVAALALGVFSPQAGRVAEAHGSCDSVDYSSFRPTGYYCAYGQVVNGAEFSSYNGAQQTQNVTMYVDQSLKLGGRSMAIVNGGGAPRPIVDWGDGTSENVSYTYADVNNNNHYLWTGDHQFPRTGAYTVKMSWWFLCCTRYDATFKVQVNARPGQIAPLYDVAFCQHPLYDGMCKAYAQSSGAAYGNLVADGFNDTTTSILVRSGIKVAVYSDGSGEGTCETFTGNDGDLRDNLIGDDRASSFWIGHSCDQDVQLCQHNDLQGRCVTFRSNKSNLTYTDIGNDTASSIRVPNGVLVSVYSDGNYVGLIDTFSQQTTKNFGSGTNVRNDSASSLRVDLRGNYGLPSQMTGVNTFSGSVGCYDMTCVR